VQHGAQGMADRYTHLPHIGLFAAAVFGGWELLVPRLRSAFERRIAAAAVMALLLALGSAAFVQTRVWRNTESLFTHALRVMPHDAVIQEAIANCDLEAGRFDGALRHAKTALDLRPRFRKARRVFELALKRRAAATPPPPDPDFLFDGRVSDALVHEGLAEIAFARGDRESALAHVRQALAIERDSIRSLWLLGALLWELGDYAGSRDALRQVVALEPDSNDAREALAAAERAPAAPQ
jgi:tetratricopeptide (TPR) repeat protein